MNVEERMWIAKRYVSNSYKVGGEGFEIENGRYTYNRALYVRENDSVILAGDKPEILLLKSRKSCEFISKSEHWWILGNLSFAVFTDKGNKWLHDFSSIRAAYEPGIMRYYISDSEIININFTIAIVPIRNEEGYVVEITVEGEIENSELLWSYGGIEPSDGNYSNTSKIDKEIFLNRYCEENIVNFFNNGASITDTNIKECNVLITTSLQSEYCVCNGENLDKEPESFFKEMTGSRMPAIGVTCPLRDNKQEGFIIIKVVNEPYNKEKFIDIAFNLLSKVKEIYKSNLEECRSITRQIETKTPDTRLDLAAKSLCLTIDACWYKTGVLHGALRWGRHTGVWFIGWRNYYGPECFGWHERIQKAIEFHLSYQVKSQEKRSVINCENGMPDEYRSIVNTRGKVPNAINFDGTPEMSVYNMAEPFWDQVYYHYLWTGNKNFAERVYPNLKMWLEHQKRVLDMDNDFLYENTANQWPTDGQWYSGGGCAVSSAFMYRLNLFGAELSRVLNQEEEAKDFENEAREIKRAVIGRLWIESEGHLAEFIDLIGRVHPSYTTMTVYHPIEFGLLDDKKAYQALVHVEHRLKRGSGVFLVNDWYPVTITNHMPSFSEMLNIAIAYFKIGSFNKGYELLSLCTNGFYKGAIPGGIPPYCDLNAEQGIDVDHNDAVSMYGRVIVEGLFGIRPRLQDGLIEIMPGFPKEWEFAEIKTPDLEYKYKKDKNTWKYTVIPKKKCKVIFKIRGCYDKIKNVTLNGKEVNYKILQGIGTYFIVAESKRRENTFAISYEPVNHKLSFKPQAVVGENFELKASNCQIVDVEDPQRIFSSVKMLKNKINGKVIADEGIHTFFVNIGNYDADILEPVVLDVKQPLEICNAKIIYRETNKKYFYSYEVRNNLSKAIIIKVENKFLSRKFSVNLTLKGGEKTRIEDIIETELLKYISPGTNRLHVKISGDLRIDLDTAIKVWKLEDTIPNWENLSRYSFETVDIKPYFNDKLSGIFTHKYEYPRSPYPSFQIDINGLNGWTGTWWKQAKDDYMRKSVKKGIFMTDIGIPFAQVKGGKNGVFCSLWDNFPTSIRIPVAKKADKIYLLITGSSPIMQSYMVNGEINIVYKGGENQKVELVNPYNYDHMFQHFSNNHPQWIGGPKDKYFDFFGPGTTHGNIMNDSFFSLFGTGSTHADIMDIFVDSEKTIEYIELKVLSMETIIGLLGITLAVST